MFFYQSEAFLRSGEFRDQLLGNAPFVVLRDSGAVRVTGTAHPVEHYLDAIRREYEKPLEERLAEFAPMWTTDAHRYVLLQSERGYLPVDVSGEEDMAVLIDEDDELAEVVTTRMREAGVPVMDDLHKRP